MNGDADRGPVVAVVPRPTCGSFSRSIKTPKDPERDDIRLSVIVQHVEISKVRT